jgi:MoxR-like ATPase
MNEASRIQEAIAVAAKGLVDRETVVELVALAAVAREHLLVIGPPGTAKSEAVRRIAAALGGTTFEYLLGRFTEPSEIFGPVDLRRLREGFVETETAGMLPEADIAFLDEVFLGSTAILNTLLGILNERTFRRGHTRMRVPLRVCVGASNALPEEPSLAAFADRFLLRTFVRNTDDPMLEALLEGGWSLRGATEPIADVAALDALADEAQSMDLALVRPRIAEAVRTLRNAGLPLSDRRVVKLQRLVSAAAALAGREVPGDADLWPILYALPDQAAQDRARQLLGVLLVRSDNPALPHAAEEASSGPRARATRIGQAGVVLLGHETRDGAWKLRVEGVLREIDASFSTLPADLAAVRTQLAAALS